MLKIEIDRQDYKAACAAVKKLLDAIKAVPIDLEEAVIENMPDADEIVDAVWDAIQ